MVTSWRLRNQINPWFYDVIKDWCLLQWAGKAVEFVRGNLADVDVSHLAPFHSSEWAQGANELSILSVSLSFYFFHFYVLVTTAREPQCWGWCLGSNRLMGHVSRKVLVAFFHNCFTLTYRVHVVDCWSCSHSGFYCSCIETTVIISASKTTMGPWCLLYLISEA